MATIKSEREIERMRGAGRIVAEVINMLKEAVKPGVSTLDLEHRSEKLIRRSGGIPSFLGYNGFPSVICASVNEAVVHGIPNSYLLSEGDIVSLDVGVIWKDYHSDGAITIPVGAVGDKAKKLIEVTEKALHIGIAAALPGKRISDVSHAIQKYVEWQGYSVVRKYVGHGIGRKMHEEPQVPNFCLPGRGDRLKEGMALAIEPMVNVGGCEVEVMDDDWTVVTKDRSLSAHFEHTVVIRKEGPEILTLP